MRIISMLFVLLFISVKSMALGKIAGKVTDEKSGETVIGANVIVKGTANGTSTDVDGNFTLNVAAGTYTIEVRYIGYQTKEIEDVKVTGNATTTLNISMVEASSTTLNEVVIHSSLKKENINALYVIQKNSAAISDGISADVIKKSPDRNTGEVLKRVSGTTIQDGKYVIIRGLSDRYNTALLDNTILPSTEANRKAFSFDIIPSSMVDNIVITKAATPDLPADFAGGVINVLTKEIPEENFNNISLSTSYNTYATFKDFRSGYRSSTDFLGFDDGARQLPTTFPATSQINGNTRLTKEEDIAAISKLNNNLTIKDRSGLPGMGLQASLGRSYLTKKGNKLGFVGGITYNHTETVQQNLKRQYNDFNYVDNSYKYSSNIGGVLNIGYSFKGNKIVLKNLYNKVFDDNLLYREGKNFGTSSDIKYYAFDLTQKSLLKTSLEGDHQIGKGQSKLNWVLAFNQVNNNQPDQRKVSYARGIGNTASDFKSDNTSIGKANSRLFSDLNDNIYLGAVNYSIPLDFLNKTTIKVGGLVQLRQREFDARFIGMQIANAPLVPGFDEEGEAIRSRDLTSLYGADAVNSGHYTLDEKTLPTDKYTANTSTYAGYAMFDNKFTDKLRLVWGARVESYSVQLNTLNSSGQSITPVDTTWTDLLPSANFTYSLTPKSNLRASYYRTLARPELREMSDFGYYDYELSALSKGNQHAVRTQINNADLRYEIYPNPGEVMSVSAFYKHFNNPLETAVYDASGAIETQVVNYSFATNIGAEAEIRKSLSFLGKANVWKNLNFYGNFAYIKSEVSKTISTVGVGTLSTVERPLSGQSSYVINTSLGYTTLEGDLSFNVLYNRIGQRIYLVSGGTNGNVWEAPRDLLDFQASYNLSKKSELKLNVKDILNARYRFYFDQNYNGKFDGNKADETGVSKTDDMILSEYKPGTTFSLTYTYRF